jgi:hypothetical protein
MKHLFVEALLKVRQKDEDGYFWFVGRANDRKGL